VQARAATEVKAAPRARTEEPVDDVTRGQCELRQVLVVPGGKSVVARRSRHAAMMPVALHHTRISQNVAG
jgi:hypothetical protein